MAGELLTGKNMADLGQNRHFFPTIIITSKVSQNSLHYDELYNLNYLVFKKSKVNIIVKCRYKRIELNMV